MAAASRPAVAAAGRVDRAAVRSAVRFGRGVVDVRDPRAAADGFATGLAGVAGRLDEDVDRVGADGFAAREPDVALAVRLAPVARGVFLVVGVVLSAMIVSSSAAFGPLRPTDALALGKRPSGAEPSAVPRYRAGVMAPPPSAARILLRGTVRRCPWCGRGRLFERWFAVPERCPSCGLRFQRDEGAFLGSLALNYGVAGLVLIALIVALVATMPSGADWRPITLLALSVVAGCVLAFYPFAKTIWAAIDLVLHEAHRGPDPEVAREFGLDGG